MKYGKLLDCQICRSAKLDTVIFLGFLPPVNEMKTLNSASDKEERYPLELVKCRDCNLVQINYAVPQEILFPESYPYLSGTTKILRENFKNLSLESKSKLNLTKDSLIIDIGSNDGTLLKPFKELGFNVLGVEPSQAADLAIQSGINTQKTYFNKDIAINIKNKYGNASVVTAANVFAHIHDVHEIVSGIKELCGDNGVFISESHYLLGLVKTVQYDTVYHEHLRYYSVLSLQELFKRHDLEIFDVQHIPTHGGSIRVYTGKKGVREVSKNVQDIIAEETNYGLIAKDSACFTEFANNIKNSKLKLLNLLTNIKQKGGRVFAIGAPSRASTLFSYVGLDESMIDAVMEVSNSHKLNKYMPGTKIPILDEQVLYTEQPEYALFGSWHIADELSEIIRAKGYKGKFIVPLPEPRVMESSTEKIHDIA